MAGAGGLDAMIDYKHLLDHCLSWIISLRKGLEVTEDKNDGMYVYHLKNYIDLYLEYWRVGRHEGK